MTNTPRSRLLTALAHLWLTSAFLALAFDPLKIVYEAAGGPGVHLVRRAGSLGGDTPAITETGDSERPYEVDGNTFTDYESAAQRSCNIQFDDCQRIANTDSSASFSLEDCQNQQDDCIADPPAVDGDGSASMGVASIETSDTSSGPAESDTTKSETEEAPMTIASENTSSTTESDTVEPTMSSEPTTDSPDTAESMTLVSEPADSEDQPTSAESATAEPSSEPESSESFSAASKTASSDEEEPDTAGSDSRSSAPEEPATTEAPAEEESATTDPVTTEAAEASSADPEPTLVQTRIPYDAEFDLICDL
ncbi:hypothetical protein BDV18DRAFT_131204 [Aspergillus unguis]